MGQAGGQHAEARSCPPTQSALLTHLERAAQGEEARHLIPGCGQHTQMQSGWWAALAESLWVGEVGQERLACTLHMAAVAAMSVPSIACEAS